MEDKHRFKANIAGKDYTIVGQKDHTHLQMVVDIVNNQLNQLSDLAPELTYSDRSILMAVNAVSDQLMKEAQIVELEEENKKLKQQLANNQGQQSATIKNTSNGTKDSRPKDRNNNRKFNQVPFERR